MGREYSNYAEARPLTTLGSGDYIVIVQGGVAKKILGGSIQDLVVGGFVDNETPAGDIDDLNTDFTLAANPIAASVKVYWNGIRVKETADYTISGATITFLTPPTTGDIILVDYRI